jgi:hypothetical protein
MIEYKSLFYKGNNYAQYEISSNGVIRNVRTKKELKRYSFEREPELFSKLKIGGRHGVTIHVVIKYAMAESFYHFQREYCDITFKDGNHKNICLDNLIITNKGDKYTTSTNIDGSVNVYLDNEYFVVDEDVYNNIVKKYEWNIFANNGYKIVRKKGNIARTLHDLICEEKYSVIDRQGLVVDHINRNALDNRLTNLRLVPQSINAINRTIPSIRKESFRGRDYYTFEARLNKKVYKIRRNINNPNSYKEVVNFREEFIKLRNEYINNQIDNYRIIEFIRGVNNMKSLYGENLVVEYIKGNISCKDILGQIA